VLLISLKRLQVPFEFAVKQVFEQLRNIANGHYTPPDTEIRKFGTIVFAALTMPVTEIKSALNKVMEIFTLLVPFCYIYSN